MRSPLLPRLPLLSALSAQRIAAASSPSAILATTVTGHTTPAVRDVGGASVRLRFGSGSAAVSSGGYLLAVRSEQQWLPAIAAVPGDQGLDRHGESRVGLAELMVMARPVHAESGGAAAAEAVTFLPEDALSALWPLGNPAEVVVVSQCTDFFLGLNAGRWLTIRMTQLCDAATAALEAGEGAAQGSLHGPVRKEGFEDLLRGSALRLESGVAEPPEDQAYLFHHHALSGNGGISGQRIIRAAEAAEEQQC